MRNRIRKIGTLALADMMALGMSMTAMAADMNGENGVIGEFTGQPAVQESSVTFYKEITAFNPAGSDVYAPAVTYRYSIEPAAGGHEITDYAGVKATVKAGLAGAAITGSVAWTNEEKLDTSAEGSANRKPIEISFENVSWNGAGVYRYEITETAPSYAASGLTEGDGDHIRYLDVYVKDAADAGYEIYGYVCFANDVDIDAEAAAKSEGFVNADSLAADQYHTYDLEVTKTVVNDKAMNDHDFPFTVAFTPADGLNTANIKLDTAVNDDAALGNGYAGSLSTDTPRLQNAGSVKYIGIPCGTKVEVNETVDAAGATYQVTTTQADVNVDETITGTAEGVDSGKAVVNAQRISGLETKTVDFTNTLLLISPTGIALRFAPYILLLGAGLVILVLGRIRKCRAEEN